LTDADYTEKTSSGKWILAFYAPWCPHCKKLKPDLESAGIVAYEKDLEIYFGLVDCTVETATCSRYKIRGYPTVKYMVNNRMGDYLAGRESHDFIEFAEKITTYPIGKADNIDDFADRDMVNFIYFGDEAEFKIFEKVATFYQHINYIKFGRSSKSNLEKYVKNPTYPAILLLNDDPSKKLGELYSGEFDLDSIDKWMSEREKPILNVINEYTWGPITKSGKLTFIAVSENEDISFKNLVREIGSSNDKYAFAFMDSKKFEQFLSQFGVEDVPAVLIYDGPNSVHYINNTYPKTTEGILNFIKAYENGEIERAGPGAGYQAMITNMLEHLAEFIEDNLILSLIFTVVLTILLAIFCSYIFFDCSDERQPEKEKTD
jgi:thiol-disulfide isomerase/thioredoxin